VKKGLLLLAAVLLALSVTTAPALASPNPLCPPHSTCAAQ